MEKEVIVKALLNSISSRNFLKQVLTTMHQEQNLQLEDILALFQEIKQEITIPLSIFSSKTPPVEALCSYLSNSQKMSYREIAILLGRNEKSIWSIVKKSKQKKPSLKNSSKALEKYFLPLSVIQNNSHTLLENIIIYLRTTYKLKNPQIAKLLHKSPNSIAVLAKRAREKE